MSEIRAREQQVIEMREQVDARAEETARLQKEVDAARVRQEYGRYQASAFNVKEVDVDEHVNENGHMGHGGFFLLFLW